MARRDGQQSTFKLFGQEGTPKISIMQAGNIVIGNDASFVINPSQPTMNSKKINAQQPLTTSTEPLTLNQKLDIKDKVGRQWKDLARRLGFVDSELEQLEMEHRGDYSEIIYQILTRWEQRLPEEATQKVLARIFEQLGRGDLADLLCNKF